MKYYKFVGNITPKEKKRKYKMLNPVFGEIYGEYSPIQIFSGGPKIDGMYHMVTVGSLISSCEYEILKNIHHKSVKSAKLILSQWERVNLIN